MVGNDKEKWIGILEGTLLGFILFAAVVGNMLVCAVVYRRSQLRRTVTHIFITNLAATDISVALLCMPFSIITAITRTWIYSSALCILNGFLNVFFLLASILTLTAISVHKYLRIVKPMQHSVTRRKALFGVAWVWLLALVTALTPLMGWNDYEYIEGRTQCSVKVPQSPSELTNCLFIVICGFVLPLGVMSFSYHKIFHTVRKHTKRVRLSQMLDNRENTSFLSEKRITVTLFIILAVFLGCWSPFSVLTIYATLTGHELDKHFSVAAYWLGFLNSALNPLIYALRTREFRDGYREILGNILPCVFHKVRRRTLSTTFPWSQADQRSVRSSIPCPTPTAGQGIGKRSSNCARNDSAVSQDGKENQAPIERHDLGKDQEIELEFRQKTRNAAGENGNTDDPLSLASKVSSHLPQGGNSTAQLCSQERCQARNRSLSDSAIKKHVPRRKRETRRSLKQARNKCALHSELGTLK